MKKIFMVISVVLSAVIVFSACSNSAENENKTTNDNNTSASEQATDDASKTTENKAPADIPEIKKSKVDIDDAKISSGDASNKVSELDIKTLGLKGKKEDYKFMVSTEGKSINGVDYFEVIASVVEKENEDGSISMSTAGDYYVSYDGTKILVRDMTTGEMSEIK